MANPIQNNKIQELVHSSQRIDSLQRSESTSGAGLSFESIFNQLNLKVSGHAQSRLQSREIQIDKHEWEKVHQAINQAAEKGAKESLVFLKRDASAQDGKQDVALIVSVKNRTVITAVQDLKENVFTNIDSAVIVES